ncbi:hypothetical protein [Paenibacillus sp. 7541]|uniref:hypothetical protein n=1 Tax=Paenibacillus sp. 7541 TaxID=2026236 RepID=UPI000BA7C3F1|nr:hypothetical protein [Paenibacillus sp. 7541]PAK55419.1 hypothetical protein CHH75_04025 [Paenibacillus sp. 7541]
MSLCLSLYHDNKFFVWADSRVSVEVGGRNYAVTDDYTKLHQLGNRVIFMSGMQEIIDEMLLRLFPESTYEDIQREARDVYDEFVEVHKDLPGYTDSKHGIEFGIYVHEIEQGQPKYVQLGYRDNFEINEQIPQEADVFGVAAHSDVALPLFVDRINSRMPVELAAQRTFEHVADEIVGGYLNMYVIHSEGVAHSRSIIRDRKPIKTFQNFSLPLKATMDGSIYASKLTARTASIAESNFTNGAIVGSSINVGNGQFTVDPAGNMYAGNGRFRGNIEASSFTGGTITGALLRTGSSGRRIEVDAQGLRTYDGSGQNRIRINTGSDAGVASIVFNGSGGGYAGEINSYQNGGLTIFSENLIIGSNNTSNPISIQGAATFAGPVRFNSTVSGISVNMSDVYGLSATLSSLQSQIDSLRSSYNSHTHSLTLPTHNHGNSSNQNWGGTFPTGGPR